MRQVSLVYGLIAVFIGTERFLRQGKAATCLRGDKVDRGSTRAVGKAFGVSINVLLVTPILNRGSIGLLPKRAILFWVGVPAMVAGLLLRGWANRVLGAAYTRTLRVVPEQQVIQAGPYRVIRHPGYLGTLLVWLGAVVALGNWISITAVSTIVLRAYTRRIGAEEQMLLDTFGDEYRRYMDRTRRLVPLVY